MNRDQDTLITLPHSDVSGGRRVRNSAQGFAYLASWWEPGWAFLFYLAIAFFFLGVPSLFITKTRELQYQYRCSFDDHWKGISWFMNGTDCVIATFTGVAVVPVTQSYDISDGYTALLVFAVIFMVFSSCCIFDDCRFTVSFGWVSFALNLASVIYWGVTVS